MELIVIGCAQAPDLATDGRQRPSRFKPHEERELEEMSARPAFHALPIKSGSPTFLAQGHLHAHTPTM